VTWQRKITSGVLLMAAIAASTLDSVTAQQPTPPLLEQVRAAWARREEAVKTLRVSWESKRTTPKGVFTGSMPHLDKSKPATPAPPQDTVHKGTGQLLLDGIKARFTNEEPVFNGSTGVFVPNRTESTFDESVFSQLILREDGIPQMTINTEKRNRDGWRVEISPVLAAVRGLKPDLVPDHLGHFTQARSVAAAGRPLVELTRPRDETRGEQKLWVDPAADFSTVRVEQFDREGRLSSRLTATPGRGPSGIWLPERWTFTKVKPDGKLYTQVEVTVQTCEVGVATSAADFQLVPPVGTRVYDTSGPTPRESITREGRPDRVILPSEKGNPNDLLAQTETGDLAPKTPISPWTWVVIVAGSMITLGSLGLLVRSRRRRTPASIPLTGEVP
jgi:hypothetical protein